LKLEDANGARFTNKPSNAGKCSDFREQIVPQNSNQTAAVPEAPLLPERKSSAPLPVELSSENFDSVESGMKLYILGLK
jgi:hypothetical protein